MAQTMAFSTNQDQLYRDQTTWEFVRHINKSMASWCTWISTNALTASLALPLHLTYRVVRSSSLVRTIRGIYLGRALSMYSDHQILFELTLGLCQSTGYRTYILNYNSMRKLCRLMPKRVTASPFRPTITDVWTHGAPNPLWCLILALFLNAHIYKIEALGSI